MLRNILAAIGLIVVAKKGYAHYREYSDLKREKEERDSSADNEHS